MGVIVSDAYAQANPVPLVDEPLVPVSVGPGGPGFRLTVNGTGFVPSSIVKWNGSPRTTTFVSSMQLTAAIPATDIATTTTALITVVNPSPRGGTSNFTSFSVTTPGPFGLAPSIVASGQNPAAYAVVSDFNGDGLLDLAVTSPGDNAVHVLLGNGDGTFQSPVAYATGTTPQGVLNGDFNGDGKLDLAVVNNGSNTVSIFLGNGDGTFQARMDLATGAAPSLGTVGDFNGDGNLDLAVGNTVDHTISVLLGKGDGSFQPRVDYPNCGGGRIRTADFNRDGKLDLAVSGCGVNASAVNILLGNGDGTFQAPLAYAVGNSTSGTSVADFNGDDKLDLAVTWVLGNRGCLSILLGNGDGTFQPPQTPYPCPEIYFDPLITGDFNGDGKLDLASAFRDLPVLETFALFLPGNGDGTFSPSQSGSINGIYGSDVVAGDFNRDGRLDVAVPGDVIGNTSGGVAIFLQIPKGLVISPSSLTFANQLVGTTSAAQSVTITNPNSEPVQMNVGFTAGTADFTQNFGCPLTLAGGASCVVQIAFAPTTTGNLSTQLGVNNTGPIPSYLMNISGTGISSNGVTLSATHLDFGNQAVGTTSAAQALTLANFGTASLMISGVTLAPGDFAQTNTCPVSPATLAIGASCAFNITFTPTTTGLRVSSITVSDNDPGSPRTTTFAGTGTVAPAVSLAPSGLTFPIQMVGSTSSAQTVTLTNTGNATLMISSLTASGAFNQTNTCGASVSAGATCTISVTFSPTAADAVAGAVSIADNASVSPHTVVLSGTGQDFLIGAAPITATVTAGQTASYTIGVSGTPGSNGTIAVTCTGAPQNSVCTVVPSSAALSGTTVINVNVSVTTRAASIVALPSVLRPPVVGKPWQLACWLVLAIAALLVTWDARARRRAPGRLAYAVGLLVVLVLGAIAMSACGGGGGTTSGGGNSGTPPGTYPLTVTGSYNSGTTTVNHTTMLTLTVR